MSRVSDAPPTVRQVHGAKCGTRQGELYGSWHGDDAWTRWLLLWEACVFDAKQIEILESFFVFFVALFFFGPFFVDEEYIVEFLKGRFFPETTESTMTHVKSGCEKVVTTVDDF